jgi:hypothetical protein
MRQTLNARSAPKLLESAYMACKSKRADAHPSEDGTLAEYQELFAPLTSAVPGEAFERFSLTDPSIRTFISATTNPPA